MSNESTASEPAAPVEGTFGTASYGASRSDPRRLKGCICHARNPKWHRVANGVAHDIDPECVYHQLAAEYPDDHSIPWNCPTYYDGCNCNGVPDDE